MTIHLKGRNLPKREPPRAVDGFVGGFVLEFGNNCTDVVIAPDVELR